MQMYKRVILIFSIVATLCIYDYMLKKAPGATDDGFNEFDEPEESASYKYSKEAQELPEEDEGIEIRAPGGGAGTKAFTPINMPPVRFAFCISCGYLQAFDQFSQLLRDKYPGIEIVGESYTPSPLKAFVAQFIGFAKIALILMVIVGRNPFQSMGMPTPATVFKWIGKKLASSLMLFMLSNAVEGMLTSSGAFEIYLGKVLIWSRIESGRVPSPPELFHIIDTFPIFEPSGSLELFFIFAAFSIAGFLIYKVYNLQEAQIHNSWPRRLNYYCSWKMLTERWRESREKTSLLSHHFRTT